MGLFVVDYDRSKSTATNNNPIKKHNVNQKQAVRDKNLRSEDKKKYDASSNPLSSTSAERKLVGVAHGVTVRSLKRKYRSEEKREGKETEKKNEIEKEKERGRERKVLPLGATNAYLGQPRRQNPNQNHDDEEEDDEEADQIARANIMLSALDEYSSSQDKEKGKGLHLEVVEQRRHYTDMALDFEYYTPSPSAQRALVKGLSKVRERRKLK